MTVTPTDLQLRLMALILEERERQDALFGTAGHPDKDPTVPALHLPHGYGIPSPRAARIATERAAREGRLAWPHILVEELSEAVAMGGVSTKLLRRELVQVAAVSLAWLEDLATHPRPDDTEGT